MEAPPSLEESTWPGLHALAAMTKSLNATQIRFIVRHCTCQAGRQAVGQEAPLPTAATVVVRVTCGDIVKGFSFLPPSLRCPLDPCLTINLH